MSEKNTQIRKKKILREFVSPTPKLCFFSKNLIRQLGDDTLTRKKIISFAWIEKYEYIATSGTTIQRHSQSAFL